MLERDGYPQGVPCWVDTAQPDPQAAVEFYGGLFGWEFEDRMPADAPGNYFVATIRGKDVAAIGSQHGGLAAAAVLEHVRLGRERRRRGRQGQGGRRQRPGRALRRHGGGPHGGARRPAGRADQRLAGGRPPGRPARQRAGHLELQRAEHQRHRRRARLLRRRLRLAGGPDRSRPGRVLSMWRLPGYGDYLEQRDPGPAPPHGGSGCAARLRGRGRLADAARTAARRTRAPHWSVTFAVDDADAAAAKADRAGRQGAGALPWTCPSSGSRS